MQDIMIMFWKNFSRKKLMEKIFQIYEEFKELRYPENGLIIKSGTDSILTRMNP